jgi:ArsR family transcriptional regulator
MSKTAIPEQFLESIALRFRAMGEPSRLRILQALMAGERSVSGLVQALGLTHSNTSRHLQALYEARLVGRRKNGLEVIYYVADPIVAHLCELMCNSERERLEAAWREAGLPREQVS